jgi:hypothetical protein
MIEPHNMAIIKITSTAADGSGITSTCTFYRMIGIGRCLPTSAMCGAWKAIVGNAIMALVIMSSWFGFFMSSRIY